MHYFAPGVSCGERAAHEIPEFKRVLSAGPWYACNSNQGGKSGTLIMQSPMDQAPPYTEGWRECADGLLYLPPKVMPGTLDLVKADRRMRTIDVTTSRGITMSIPVAASSAREIDFSAHSFGEPADDFGRAAFAYFDRLSDPDEAKRPKLGEPATIEFVLLAVQQLYRVTAELLNDLRWISTTDIAPIVDATLGVSESKTSAAGGISRSSAAA